MAAAIGTMPARWACSTAVSAGDSSEKVPVRGNAYSGRDEFRGTFERRSAAHGNPEPSRRYTAGRCRDYLRASVPLMTGRSIPHPHGRNESPSIGGTCPFAGEEIVHSRRKRRGKVNPLVVGSNPTGPNSTQVAAAQSAGHGIVANSALPGTRGVPESLLPDRHECPR